MTASIDHFERLKQKLPTLEELSSAPDEIGYFAQEALRFYSIAGTLRENEMLKNESAVKRQISHILGRSLLEGFFWLTYIFDEPAQQKARFCERIDVFKREYGKLWNEPLVPGKQQMEPADPGWATLPRPKDINTILAQVKNIHGDRLSYLYFVYRVASFDTHGNSVPALFHSVFGKDCNFSVLKLDCCFDLIANQYLVILQVLRDTGKI